MRGNDRIIHSSGGGAGASGAGLRSCGSSGRGGRGDFSQVEGAELLAAGVNVDEEQASELYDTNIEDANCHQLVLVVRFAGDTTGDGDTGLNAVSTGSSITNWQSVYTSLNGKPLSRYASPSLYSYLKEVSAGRCRIQSIVPQMSDDGRTVTYLTLPGSRDSYVAQ